MPVPTSKAVRPADKLQPQPVCDVLLEDIIEPVQQNNWNVSAFRMNWARKGIDEQSIWDQIVVVREELDSLAKTIPGALFTVSAISASYSKMKSGQKTIYKTNPFVGYWLVSQGMIDTRTLCDTMSNNKCEAQAKIVLQPYQTTKHDIKNALFTAVKDNTASYVRRLVEDCCERYYGPTKRTHEPLVKIFVANNGPKDMLTKAVANLADVRFYAEILDMEMDAH